MIFLRLINFFIVLFLSLALSSLAHARLPAAIDGQPLPSLADMLERITPAVVNISTEQGGGGSTPVNDPVYRHFFGKNVPGEQGKSVGSGSGIIIDAENGYIVTNAHVIELKGKIVFSTFHQSKGRERKVVLVFNFDQSYFKYYGKELDPNVCPNELYVATTRAQEHLSLFHH